ncbi:hypothetical protein K435DRAFT_50897 [Dendrothele bispora CBS 962.96]|uniref:RanBP2-type domain-containing protein n=1 Tax=Dendrothele bispora (strain CBS 962.96) TaxID=1314807 RepID=A0A4S8M6G4_DENBC|nr:hypothetical protein K435DRAFT_50897 [Dendrothele bispora CBS 962.96]
MIESPPPVHAFLASRSRVLCIRDLPTNPQAFLAALFQTTQRAPKSLWAARDDLVPLDVWAVFETHAEACAFLAQTFSVPISVVPAQESDLEPFHKLVRFHLQSPSPSSQSRPHRPPMLHLATTPADFNLSDGPRVSHPISSNPPNPRTNFRLGDWICPSPKCGAHNFGRNLACIGCGCSRTHKSSVPPPPTPSSRPPPSPRFATSPSSQVPFSLASPKSQGPLSSYPTTPQSPYSSVTQADVVAAAATAIAAGPSVLYSSKSGHPLLTPSGRAFAVGGRVQNVSSDPLSPCIMYWPDNEPFPEPGQIRPSSLAGVPHPPILNTGNRGPIAHQPGDWICQKCNYLNWRRRKVCQTCLPYAEGNGDSISTAVQAERIALLTSVLAQTQVSSPSLPPLSPSSSQALRSQVLRSHSVTPPQVRRPFIDASSSPRPPRGNVVHRSQSQVELGAHYQKTSPIYQTSGSRREQRLASPVYSTPSPLQQQQQQQQKYHFIPPQVESQQQQQTYYPMQPPLAAPAPAPLLPSFLQDIVQSPTLSPSSTSSSIELSLEEYDGTTSSGSPSSRMRSRQTSGDSASFKFDNIWRMDGEESKSLSNGFRLPGGAATTRTGDSRKSSLEKLRC